MEAIPLVVAEFRLLLWRMVVVGEAAGDGGNTFSSVIIIFLFGTGAFGVLTGCDLFRRATTSWTPIIRNLLYYVKERKRNEEEKNGKESKLNVSLLYSCKPMSYENFIQARAFGQVPCLKEI